MAYCLIFEIIQSVGCNGVVAKVEIEYTKDVLSPAGGTDGVIKPADNLTVKERVCLVIGGKARAARMAKKCWEAWVAEGYQRET